MNEHELKVTNVEPRGPIEKRLVPQTNRSVFVMPCIATLQDGGTYHIDITARKKKDLDGQRQSIIQYGYHEPGSHFTSMRYCLR